MSAASRTRETKLRLEDLAVRQGEPVTEAELPRIAVVIPTLDGWHELEPCLQALAAQEYPRERLQVVVIDNGSRDGTARAVAGRHPHVTLLANATNTGFSAASNQGAKAAEGARVLVFLNNDVRVERGFLRELVSPIVRGECAATSAKMLSFDGRRIDHAGGGASLQGIAIAYGYGDEPGPRHDFPRRSLFACGGAMAMDAALFRRLGGFDEDFFAYYEDLDLGWRTWIAGAEVHYAPRAVCVHRHSSTARRFPPEALRMLQSRNPLLTAYKNYGDASLATLLPALLALHVRRAWVMARMGEARAFRLDGDTRKRSRLRSQARKLVGGGHGRARVGKLAVSDLAGVADFLDHFGAWAAKRRGVQALRQRDDREIFRLFLHPLWCVEADADYSRLQSSLIEEFGLARLFEGCTIEGADPRG